MRCALNHFTMNYEYSHRFTRFVAAAAAGAAGAAGGSSASSAWLGSAINAGGNLGSSIAGMAIQSHKDRKARKWAERMYQRQVDDAIAQWNRENQYNAPVAALERLKQAGLNPLYYGLDGNPAANMAIPSAPSPPSYSAPQFGDVGSDVLNGLVTAAQIDNLQADTANKREDNQTKQTFNQFYEDMLRGEVEYNNVKISLGKEQTSLTREQAKEVQQHTAVLSQEWQNLEAQRGVIQTDKELKQFELEFRKATAPLENALKAGQLEELRASAMAAFSQAGLFAAEAKLKQDEYEVQHPLQRERRLFYVAQLAGQQKQNRALDLANKAAGIQNQTLQVNLDLAKKFGAADHVVGYIGDIVKAAGVAVGAVVAAKKGFGSVGQGSMVTTAPSSTMNTGYQGSYGSLP